MDVRRVVEWLENEVDANAVVVTARLLGCCAAGEGELWARWADRRYQPAVQALREHVLGRLQRYPSLRLDRPQLRAIAGALELGRRLVGEPLAAHTVATAIDAALGSRFSEYFDEDRVLALGDAFPIKPAPTVELVGKDDSPGRPENLTAPLIRTTHLGIVTVNHGIGLRLRHLGSRLRPLHAKTTVATVATNADVLELTADFYDPQQRPPGPTADWTGGRGYFYGVRPGRFGDSCESHVAAVEEQKRRILDGVRAAAHAGSEIVVLPELSTTDAIHAWLMTIEEIRAIPLFVAGSRHVATPQGVGPGTNLATVLVRGTEVGCASKFTDFNLRLPAPLPAVPFHEDLDRGRTPSIEVFVGSSTTVIVLICKDAMDSQVIEVVRQLAPTLLITPAMSTEVERFESMAHDLAHYPQVVTIVANIGRTSAVVGMPSRTRPPVKESCENGKIIQVRLCDGKVQVFPAESTK